MSLRYVVLIVAAEASRGRPRARYGSGGKGEAMSICEVSDTSQGRPVEGVLSGDLGGRRH
jgi:hypothetical protein